MLFSYILLPLADLLGHPGNKHGLWKPGKNGYNSHIHALKHSNFAGIHHLSLSKGFCNAIDT